MSPFLQQIGRRAAVCCFALILGSSPALAQSQLELTIQQFRSSEVGGYVQPLGDLFGANMNAGLFHSAAVPQKGFHIRIDVIGMVAPVGEQYKVYDATLPSGFVPQGGSYKTATVFGGRGTTFKDVSSGLEYRGSDGIVRVTAFPLLVPQLTIGSLFGTEATVRYMRTPQLSQNWFPTRSILFGIGLRHSISQYLRSPEVDVSIGAFYSSFALGDIIDVRAQAVNLSVSKTVSLFTPYIGLGYERSTMHLHYDFRGEGEQYPRLVDIVIEGANRFRVTGGLMIDLQALRLFADANFGNVHHYSGGIGFGF